MTAKKPESEKVTPDEVSRRQSLGATRRHAKKRAADATYTDIRTGKRYVGGLEVSEVVWAAFISENPEYADVTEGSLPETSIQVGDPVETATQTEPIVVTTTQASLDEYAETMSVAVVEDEDGRLLSAPVRGAHGSETVRHLHEELGRPEDPGLWHAHTNGGYPHTHPEEYGAPVPTPPQDLPMLTRKDEDKTDEEKDHEHALALEAARKADAEAKVAFPVIGDDEGEVSIHFLEDGFSLCGKVWLRGETLTLKKGSPLWELTLDADGTSVVMRGENEQRVRYGKHYFSPGVWPYERADIMSEQEYDMALSTNDLEAIRRFERQQKALAGVVPPDFVRPRRG